MLKLLWSCACDDAAAVADDNVIMPLLSNVHLFQKCACEAVCAALLQTPLWNRTCASAVTDFQTAQANPLEAVGLMRQSVEKHGNGKADADLTPLK